jgi:hypothetical protein
MQLLSTEDIECVVGADGWGTLGNVVNAITLGQMIFGAGSAMYSVLSDGLNQTYQQTGIVPIY